MYHLVDRAKEEATLIQEEMGNVIEHSVNGHHATFSASLADATASPLSMEERGKHVFIRMKLLSIEGQLLELKQLFQGHIGEIPLPNFVFDQGSIPSNNDEEEAEEVSDSLLSLPETMMILRTVTLNARVILTMLTVLFSVFREYCRKVVGR